MKTFKLFLERNYAKEYENYQGKPEQIEKRSSRNKARRLMAKKMNVKGKDVGHKDNDPLNNDPKNLRLEDPSVNRREPRLRDNPVEESVQEFNGPRSRGLLHRKGVKGTSFANKMNKTHSQNKTDQQKAAARQKAAAADHSHGDDGDDALRITIGGGVEGQDRQTPPGAEDESVPYGMSGGAARRRHQRSQCVHHREAPCRRPEGGDVRALSAKALPRHGPRATGVGDTDRHRPHRNGGRHQPGGHRERALGPHRVRGPRSRTGAFPPGHQDPNREDPPGPDPRRAPGPSARWRGVVPLSPMLLAPAPGPPREPTHPQGPSPPRRGGADPRRSQAARQRDRPPPGPRRATLTPLAPHRSGRAGRTSPRGRSASPPVL